MTTTTLTFETDNRSFLHEVKALLAGARVAAPRAGIRELMALYWSVGRLTVERQEALDWGLAIIERLVSDLKPSFPGMTGLSPQNLWAMRQFYLSHRNAPDLQQRVGETPWAGTNRLPIQSDWQHLPSKSLTQPAPDADTKTVANDSLDKDEQA